MSVRRSIVITVLNQKGGVGKTTTTINLAAALAASQERVVILDADRQQQTLPFAGGFGGASNVQVVSALGAQPLREAVADSDAHWTLIDCPPSLLEAAPAVPLCDLVLAPLPPRVQDISGFAELRQTIDAVRDRGRAGLQLRILLTMRDARVSLQGEFEAHLRAAFPSEMFQAVIPRTALFERAANAGEPVLLHAPSSPAAAAYRALAEEVRKLYPNV